MYGLRTTDKVLCMISTSLTLSLSPSSSPGRQMRSFSACTYINSTHSTVHGYLTICTYHHCCDDPRCRCILSFGCSQIGIGTMGSCREFVPALFCSHRLAWVQLSWLHYGVLKFIGHGNDSKPGPSMARNRCYRLVSTQLYYCVFLVFLSNKN